MVPAQVESLPGLGRIGPVPNVTLESPKTRSLISTRVKRGRESSEEEENAASPRRPLRSSPPSKAARLPHFAEAWQQVTDNSFILNIVINGYKIQFTSIPVQSVYTPRNMSKANIGICHNKVSEFLTVKIIKVVTPCHDQFVSHIFPVPKTTLGEYRIIFYLSDLNTYVRKVSFRMDSLADIMKLIRPGDWFVSVDLSDAYYCIAMHILSMPFLTFKFLEVLYQFTCLP